MTNLLARIPLFGDLPPAELDHLVAALQVVQLRAGEVLFREGEPGEHLYIVLDGELEVLRGLETREEMRLNTIGPGECLGEMSLILPGGQRTASVRAQGPAVLLVMTRAEFDDLLLRQPMMAYSMARVLSARLTSTSESTFRNLTEKNRQLQQAYDELKAAQEQLIEKERLERELQVAAGIQMSILPDRLPEPPGFDFGARILPARQVGGDFYDVFPMRDGRFGVLIGDVADKGVPSAIFMARVHALIAAEADNYSNPGDVLRRVNRHITQLEKATQFVTALYGVLDMQNREFAYARAGHEPPLLVTPKGKVQRIPYEPGMALGLWDQITLDERTLTLQSGATLLLFTDGITDCRNPRGEPFGLERVQSTLGRSAELRAQEICNRLLKALKDYQRDSPQDDDVTLVAMRAAG